MKLVKNIPDLSDMNTRMHTAGFGAAVGAFIFSAMAFSGQLNILQLGTFIAVFYPVMYSFELVLNWVAEQ